METYQEQSQKSQYNGSEHNYNEDVNDVYRQGMGASGTQQAMRISNGYTLPKKSAQPTTFKVPASLQERPKPSLIPAKPKMSLVNNRNKHDHVQALLCGVAKPKATDEAVAKKPTSAASNYRSTYVFEEEAKEMVTGCD